MVRSSVEAELHGNTPVKQAGNVPQNGTNQLALGNPPASPKQINYLLSLASRRGIIPQQIAAQNNVASSLLRTYDLKFKQKMVAGPRIELGTQGFSVPCSTD